VPRYAAFLRGINLGKRRVTSDGLRSCLEDLGFEDVATFRASGNVIFTISGRQSPAKVTARVEEGLADALGYEVPTFLRTGAEVQAIAAHEPFPAKVVDASKGKLQIMLLPAQPAAARKQALALATDEDRLAIHERELYWQPNGGISDSALDLKAIEKLLGAGTIRTKATVDQIAEKYFAMRDELDAVKQRSPKRR
jgi:uncharacterized protein (DUF1697 family)